MEYLRNMRVGPRLSLGFGVLLAMLIASSTLALQQTERISNQVDTMETNNRKMNLLYGLRRANFDNEQNLRDLILNGDDEGAAIRERFNQVREVYARTLEQLDSIPQDHQGEAAKQAIKAAQAATVVVHNQIAEAASSGNDEAAKALLYGEAKPLMEARAKSIQDAVELQERRNEAGSETINEAIKASYSMLVGFALLALISGVLLAWFTTRSLVLPMRRAMALSKAIAEGRFDAEVGRVSGDETGQLLCSMDEMRRRLQSFSSAQQDMAEKHDSGELSFRIDTAQFPGDFGRIADGTNSLVGESIELTERIIAVIGSYAVGDLTQDMESLPGQKARFTEAMATTKRNLSSINGEIHRLASAAAAGDFSARGDETSFDHQFRTMIERLNMMMSVSDGNLRQLSQLLKAIAAGDLTQRLEGQYQGVFSQMRDDANSTVSQLTSIIGSIQTATGSITTAATEIASGNTDLSRRTEQQAANLEETAASMEELTSTVRQNAEHARQANQLAIGASTVASHGGQVVHQVVATMQDIQASSARIADIISVIDGIAFQTNILALNAAVEAARAGDQGRGFAVVASEVRTLAQRSAAAAKEIKELIEDAGGKVALGSELVAKAGVSMDEIVSSVQRVTSIMAEISAASQEQTAGIEQVSQTVVQLDETTQQNAALVEEATAAARSMEDQAQMLTGAVSRFRLSRTKEAGMEQILERLTPAFTGAMTTKASGRSMVGLKERPPVSRARAPLAAEASAEAGDWREF